MYLLAQNRVQKYLGAVAARPRAGFGRVISRGGPNLVLTRVVTAPNNPPRYVIAIKAINLKEYINKIISSNINRNTVRNKEVNKVVGR